MFPPDEKVREVKIKCGVWVKKLLKNYSRYSSIGIKQQRMNLSGIKN